MSGGYVVCQNGSMFAEPVGFRPTMHHYRRPPNTSRVRPDDRRYVPVPRPQAANYPRPSHHHHQRLSSYGGRLSPAIHHQHPAGDYSGFHYRQQHQQVNLQQEQKVLAMWHTNEHQFPGILRLHEEIIAFYKDMSPLPEERQMRQDVVRRVTDAIRNRWPGTLVEVFGSMRTGLYLPTSDIDLVVFHGFDRTPFSDIRDELISRGICTNQTIKVLESASVPIIKLTDQLTQVKVDIGFNIGNSQRSADLVQAYIHQYPALPYLVIVLKQFLYQHELNEVYSGGISSYSLVLLTISFLQSRSYTGRMTLSANYGVLLLEFFQLYSRLFQFQRVVVSVTRAGGCHVKPWIDNVQQPSLSIEDPLCSENDVARGSYNVSRVQAAFAGALRQLNEEIYRPIYVCPSPKGMLSSIVRVPAEIERYRYWVQQRFPVAPECSASTVSLSACHGPFELSSSSGISSASPEPRASVSCSDSVETSDVESDDDGLTVGSTQTCTVNCNNTDFVSVPKFHNDDSNSTNSLQHVNVSTPQFPPKPTSSSSTVLIVADLFHTQAIDPVDDSFGRGVLGDFIQPHGRRNDENAIPHDDGESVLRASGEPVETLMSEGSVPDEQSDAAETGGANIEQTMRRFARMAVHFNNNQTVCSDEINTSVCVVRSDIALCHANCDTLASDSCFEVLDCEPKSALCVSFESATNCSQAAPKCSTLHDSEMQPERREPEKMQSCVNTWRPSSSNPKGDNLEDTPRKGLCMGKPANQLGVDEMQADHFIGLSCGEKVKRPGVAQSLACIEPVIRVNYDHLS